MTPLPRSPASAVPLMHLEAWLYVSLGVTAGVLLLGLYWLWRQWRKRHAAAPDPPQPAPPAHEPTGLADDVARIRKLTLEHRRYRDGCHALSRVVKERLASAVGRPVQNMTAAEIAALFKDERIDRLVQELRGDKYNKRPPRVEAFERHCRRIPVVLGQEQSFELEEP